MKKALSVLAIVAFLAAPAWAQAVVNASNPVFAWTGKAGEQASYSWSASVSNPSKREVTALVSLQLIDASGAVVAADSKTVVIGKQTAIDVSGENSLPHSDARRATQYRITVEGVES